MLHLPCLRTVDSSFRPAAVVGIKYRWLIEVILKVELSHCFSMELALANL